MGTSEEYEDDFEEYDDDFEEEEEVQHMSGPMAIKPSVARERFAAPQRHSPPWSLITLDELDLGEELARGAFSRVHSGVWRGRNVAIKVLTDNSVLRQCEEELLVHAALNDHAGIVRLHGANLCAPDCCIVMERCRCSLFERAHRQIEDMDRRWIVGVGLQVAEAMAFLHAQSPPVVHRDLKSHNVLLDDNGRCKLCDFGLVGTREVTAGTPNYMAPELFQAKAYSCAVDTFAFAVLLNELFTREVPWDGYQPLDIKDKVVAGERPRIPRTMPSACEGLVKKAWHQNAAMRPPFKQIVGTLHQIEETLPFGASLHGANRYADALDEFAMLGLNKTV